MTSAEDDMLATISLQEYLALKAERDTLAASAEYHKGMAAKWESEAKADLVRIAQLEAALLEYGYHDVTCDFLRDTLPCTCGFESLLASLALKEPT